MNFEISDHAVAELHRRGIPRAVLDAVLATPGQKTPGHGGIVCYQSRVTINAKSYLLRAMVAEEKRPPVVVTVYRTSKVSKYRRQP